MKTNKYRLIPLISNNVCKKEKNILVAYLNSYSYLKAREKVKVFKKFDCIEIDGIAMVIFMRIFGFHVKKRKSFDMSSMAASVFKEAESEGQSVFFIGAHLEEIELAAKKIHLSFQKLNLIGYRHGYFDDIDQRALVIEEIVNLKPDIVVCGMGTPLQEEFLIDLRDAGWRGTGYTCGGFFHQSARKLEYYPRLFDKLQLRWLYRMIQEPRLAKRYLLDYPKFVFIFFWDYIQWRIYRLQGKEQ